MRYALIICVLFLFVPGALLAQVNQQVTLPNGWKLSPAGESMPLGDLPLNLEVSPSGRLMAVTNNGQGIQTIELIDLTRRTKTDSILIKRAWYGLAFSRDEKQLYVSGGHNNNIPIYSINDNNKLQLSDSITLGAPWPNRVGPAGITIDPSRNRLYVVTREDKMLYVLDLRKKTVLSTFGIPAEGYASKLSKNKDELFISCWGCDKVLIFDLTKNVWKQSIHVGDNPNELLLTSNGKHLLVCNANDNTVSVVDLKQRRVIETLDAALFPNSPSGSTTNSLALDEKSKTLYIANADNNCLAAFDFSKPGQSQPLGFIPTGWYPTCVRLVGNKLWVSNGKGFESKANPFGPAPTRKREDVIHHGGITKEGSEVQYIGSLLKGTMSIITKPDKTQLAAYSKLVYENSPYTDYMKGIVSSAPIPLGKTSPIKYVFYVIKENRTYDQVLSDLKQGNGDSTLLLFGKKHTPNQHTLAESFVLLDNFYVNAEVSADGHNWTVGGYATDYIEKTWPTSYGGRGGTYGGEGEREIANNKDGFIWDNCHRYGITFRTYGEFMEDGKPTIPVLENNNCPEFPGYNLTIRDTTRFNVWKKDFMTLLRQNKVPQFNTVRFGNDHTEGMRLGRPSPYAHVADNDLAVGLFVQTLAESPIWNETVVFIVEDDAQNGADHVDAHRSTAYLAGGYIKRNFVDHTFYTTASMLRTLELILGLEPMTQYDAAATPMWNSFRDTPLPFEFKAIVPNVDLNEKNVAINIWQKKSESFNHDKEDSNNDIEFNLVLWHGLKGDIPFPGPTRAAFVTPLADDDDE